MDYDIGDDGITDHQRVFNIHYEINPETVGQYTGLKDRNGKDIYEGDIVQIQGHPFEGPNEMKKYRAIAKDDLNAHPHTWTKGLDYEWIDKGDYFTLASNEGSINYQNKVREDVANEFELIEQA